MRTLVLLSLPLMNNAFPHGEKSLSPPKVRGIHNDDPTVALAEMEEANAALEDVVSSLMSKEKMSMGAKTLADLLEAPFCHHMSYCTICGGTHPSPPGSYCGMM